MQAVAERIRRQQSEELTVAAMRALTGRVGLHFEGGRLFDGDRALPDHAPHLQLQAGIDALSSYRGITDGLALRLRYSDASLHQRLMPAEGGVERLVFEWLEQLRVESLAPSGMPGLHHNVVARYREWSAAFLDSGATETSLGILLFAFSQMAWSRLMALPLPEHIDDLLEPTRAALGPALGGRLAAMRRCREDQAAFAVHALEIAQEIAARVQAEYEDSPQSRGVRHGNFSLALEFDPDELPAFQAPQSGESLSFRAARGQYRVFTRRFDIEQDAADQVRAGLLAEFRQELDQMLARQGMNVGRLARGLRAVLAKPQLDGWLFGQEEGIIDGRRLAQLVSSPTEKRLFRSDRYVPISHSAVTFLVDCSGSMKQYGSTLAMMLDIFMRAFEQAGVPMEILGFTTRSWNGGRARREWFAQGRYPAPGRLNELCHLVFKDAATHWRRARQGIGALMKPDLFREGVDGEAVQWACGRLLAQDRQRRILVVISDGCPMDSATNLANDAFYLDNHLKAVVRQSERDYGIEVLGLGVGLDLSPYYARSLALDLSEGLDNAFFDAFLRLVALRRRRV
ncbi:cobaltochelatase CobT-related protein [Allopusillimonas ginsengisoli]|uniref:cobaltochelatase CobT-related protein n=1 Tax=Allopusillimonas ginsengisoli TaxID=453575 RepID=UPI001021A9B6|nr:cobalt chelatase [Allopusillimonas ginsengisoli]TEA78434.1 cobalt chelatase [Allopusillimonas ginsengisoli]